MKRQAPVINTAYEGGKVLETLPPAGSNRSIRVKVECSQCSKRYTCRFSDLRSGRQVSCGCFGKKRFKEYQFEKVDQMTPEKRYVLFESLELGKSKSEAATLHGVDSYAASFAWHRERQRLEGLPQEQLKAVYDLSRFRPTEYVMHKHSLRRAEVIGIYRIWKKRTKAAKEAFARLVERFRQYAPHDSLTGDVYADVVLYLNKALEAIDHSWQPDRWRGEFTQAELATASNRSDFGWIYRTFLKMPEGSIFLCFGTQGTRFMTACETTFAGRKARQKKYLESSDVLATADGVAPKKPTRKKSRKETLPAPNISPADLAELFAEFAIQRSISNSSSPDGA